MTYGTILFEKRDGVGRITLNRPDDANALNLEMMQELHTAALDCDRDPAVRAVLLTAVGKMFSGGGDLKSFNAAQGAEKGALSRHLMRTAGEFHRAISIFNRMDAPLVIAVNGVAAGGGFSLAIMGDLVIAAESARFTLAYTAAGLSPDGSSTFFLPRFIGARRAKELMLTNRMLSAAEALDYAIVDRVVADADLAEEAEKQALAFAHGPTSAYGAVKRLVNASFDESLETQMELESRSISGLADGHDAPEGIAAFTEKRKPAFKGH